MTTFIDFHALQTLAPSNINRGEDGAPKTAFFGGVQRQRVSSQALKAAQRKAFGDYLDASELGSRTKRVVEHVANRVVEKNPEIEPALAQKWAEAAFKKAGIKIAAPKKAKGEEDAVPTAGYLIFLGNHQVDRLADALIEAGDAGISSKGEAQSLIDTEHAIDVALFGRMVADDAALNVDASVQVAHALGVHAAVPDFDYYTAVDDFQRAAEETGAGMIGTVEMMSSTLYRYATINVDQLVKNLGSWEAADRAVQAFARTFVESLPSGKQNTFASHTLPELVSVAVRERRPVSYVNAFENPVQAREGEDRRVVAVQKLSEEAQTVAGTYGFEPERAAVTVVPSLREAATGLGEEVSLPQMMEMLHDTIQQRQQAAGGDAQ